MTSPGSWGWSFVQYFLIWSNLYSFISSSLAPVFTETAFSLLLLHRHTSSFSFLLAEEKMSAEKKTIRCLVHHIIENQTSAPGNPQNYDVPCQCFNSEDIWTEKATKMRIGETKREKMRPTSKRNFNLCIYCFCCGLHVSVWLNTWNMHETLCWNLPSYSSKKNPKTKQRN